MAARANWSWTNGYGSASLARVHWLAIIGIGAVVGFLGGLFGKGGAAIATPLLAAVGVPPIVAVASPLPATVPGTLVAYRRYRRLGIGEPDVIRTTILVGVPATVAGALATRWVGGDVLVTATEAVVMLIGLRLVLWPAPPSSVRSPACSPTPAASCSSRCTSPSSSCRSRRRWPARWPSPASSPCLARSSTPPSATSTGR